MKDQREAFEEMLRQELEALDYANIDAVFVILTRKVSGQYVHTDIQQRFEDFMSGIEAATRSQAQQDHIGDVNKMVQDELEYGIGIGLVVDGELRHVRHEDVFLSPEEISSQEQSSLKALREECTQIAEAIDSDYPESARDTALAIRSIDLHKFASQAQQESRWISVDERLPEPWEDVLVHPRPTEYVCEANMGRSGAAVFLEYSEYIQNYGVQKVRCEVTHWMPYPIPPAPERGE